MLLRDNVLLFPDERLRRRMLLLSLLYIYPHQIYLQKQENNTTSAKPVTSTFVFSVFAIFVHVPEKPQRRKRSHRDVTKIANCETVVFELISGKSEGSWLPTKL